MVEGKEGAGGGGGTPHHHVCRNVGKFSPLFIFVIIKQITFNLGDSTTWSMSQVEKNREKSSNNSFSYTVKLWNFIFGWKTQFTLPVKPMNLSWLIASNQHTVVTCLKNQFVFFPECYNTKPTFLFLITSWLTRPMYNKNTQWFIKRTFRSFTSLPTYYLCIHDNNFVSNKVNRCQPIYKNIERPVFSCRISILAKWLHEL